MSLKIGIVGLPNAGKSTLFNALTRKQSAAASNFPFTTIDPNIGIVDVPDLRLEKLAKIVQPQQIIPTTVTFVDIAGLVKDAHKGEGLGNKFLAHIKEVDAIALVVRFFEDPNIVHVAGKIDPIEDIETILAELALKDLEVIEQKIAKQQDKIKSNDPKERLEYNFLMTLQSNIERQIKLDNGELSVEQQQILSQLQLLSTKPLMYVFNVSETDIAQTEEKIASLVEHNPALFAGSKIMTISAKIESEIQQLEVPEQQEYLEQLGLKQTGLDQVIVAGYELLNLITFFTAGPKEVRAWTIKRGTKAPAAAGKIHTDFERGFIKAEVVAFDDYISFRGEQGAKAAGRLRLEGKEYVVQDGDVMHFKFNV